MEPVSSQAQGQTIRIGGKWNSMKQEKQRKKRRRHTGQEQEGGSEAEEIRGLGRNSQPWQHPALDTTESILPITHWAPVLSLG